MIRACVLLALVGGALALRAYAPKNPKLKQKKVATEDDHSGFHVEGIKDCKRLDKTVRLRSSLGPRHVSWEETKQPGYLDEPQLREIFYINLPAASKQQEKMEDVLTASMRTTKVNYQLKQMSQPEIQYSRFKAITVKDIKKKESKRLFAAYSTGEWGQDAQEKDKIAATWLTQVKLLEDIAKKANGTASDHTDVYFILEDDVAFLHDLREKEKKTDWIEQAMCHISKLPADWDMYKFGYWTESLLKRPKGTCGTAKNLNDYSCQQRDLNEEGQFEIMGNQAYAVRPAGAANMLKYLKNKMVMDVDGAMLPMKWQPLNQPNYYNAKVPLVWHHAPKANHIYDSFIEQESEQEEQVDHSVDDKVKEMTKPVGKPKIEAWYVNLKKSNERGHCINRQLQELGLEPHRFEGVEWPKECSGNTMCLKQRTTVGDCIEGGVGWGAVTTHGTKKKNEIGGENGDARTQRGVLGNWCSHKRLFEQLEKDKITNGNGNTEEEYFLVLEDDVVLHKNFTEKIENFIQNYDGKLNDGSKKDWHFVQIDPFGDTGKQRGKFDNGVLSLPRKEGEWFGMHAVLIKKSALPKITSWMRNHKAIPIDWIPKRMNNFLAWKPHIAENPEVVHAGGQLHDLPEYCNKKALLKSEIAGAKSDGEDNESA